LNLVPSIGSISIYASFPIVHKILLILLTIIVPTKPGPIYFLLKNIKKIRYNYVLILQGIKE